MEDLEKFNPSEMISESLRGSTVICLDHYAEDSWQLTFGPGRADLNISCPWRLVSGGAVVLGGSDHGQKFGLPQQVDVGAKTTRVLSGKPVLDGRIDEATADLCINFGDVRLDVFNDSSGYEGWTFADQHGLMLVAQGGGQIAICKPLRTKAT